MVKEKLIKIAAFLERMDFIAIQHVFSDLSQVVPLSRLIPSESKSQIGTSKLTRARDHYRSGRVRPPVLVQPRGSKFYILDGNATYWTLKDAGISQIAIQVRSRNKTAMEFPSEEAYKKYEEEHPGLDKSLHWIKDEKGKRQEDSQEDDDLSISYGEDVPYSSRQKGIKTERDFFSKIPEAYEYMVNFLDRGKGIDAKIGAKTIDISRGGNLEDGITSSSPVVIIGPVKDPVRARDKVLTKYDGDWGRLKDGIRATISVPSVKQLPQLWKTLKRAGIKLSQKPRNRYVSPTSVGYRDILLNVEYPNGHIGELQLNCHDMINAKITGHLLYEKVRAIEVKAKNEGRTKFTDQEWEVLREANSAMKKMYEEAFNRTWEKK